MRAVIWVVALLCWLCSAGFAQQTVLGLSQGKSGRDPYYEGLVLYNQGRYAEAEKKLRQAFDLLPDASTAYYLYSVLMLEGKDLMASVFKKKNPSYTYDIPADKKYFESFYADAGPRISANSNAGNMYYADLGYNIRISPRIRLWQSINYLEQNNNLGSFQQYEVFSRLDYYAGNGWDMLPAIHYDYDPNTSLSAKADSIFDTSKYITPYGTYTYITKAKDKINYTAPGYSHYTCFSFALSKTKGRFIFEAEPSLQLNYNYYRTYYKEVISGMTDSFINNNQHGGAKPYNFSGSGVVADTLTMIYIYQMGTAVTYTPPISFDPLTFRLSAFYLFDNRNHTGMAYNFFTTWRMRKNWWIDFSWEKMGIVPWALNYEGFYFNFNNKINTRAEITFLYHPQNKLSAAVTYQYENDTRFQDGARLVYNSLYLSLKYNLCAR